MRQERLKEHLEYICKYLEDHCETDIGYLSQDVEETRYLTAISNLKLIIKDLDK